MICARNRMWEQPVDFQACHGALVARLPDNMFAVYRNGRWDTYTLTEFKARFDNQEVMGCDVGGWVIIARLNVARSNSTYVEPWNGTKLDIALRQFVPKMARRMVNPKMTGVVVRSAG